MYWHRITAWIMTRKLHVVLEFFVESVRLIARMRSIGVLIEKTFGPVQTDRRQTDRKWCIWAHCATCTGWLKNLVSKSFLLSQLADHDTYTCFQKPNSCKYTAKKGLRLHANVTSGGLPKASWFPNMLRHTCTFATMYWQKQTLVFQWNDQELGLEKYCVFPLTCPKFFGSVGRDFIFYSAPPQNLKWNSPKNFGPVSGNTRFFVLGLQ